MNSLLLFVLRFESVFFSLVSFVVLVVREGEGETHETITKNVAEPCRTSGTRPAGRTCVQTYVVDHVRQLCGAPVGGGKGGNPSSATLGAGGGGGRRRLRVGGGNQIRTAPRWAQGGKGARHPRPPFGKLSALPVFLGTGLRVSRISGGGVLQGDAAGDHHPKN